MRIRLAVWLRRLAKRVDPDGEETWWVDLGRPCPVCPDGLPEDQGRHFHSILGRLGLTVQVRPTPFPVGRALNVATGHLVAGEARYYRCPQCHHAALWTDGIPEGEKDGPMIWCQTCGHEFPPAIGLPA
jgi:hypothetical protein